MGVISRYFERLAELVRRKHAQYPKVSTDAEGLLIGGERVAWSDVFQIVAYKRDIYIGDFLCLAIVNSFGQVLFEINESSPGWKEAGEAIQQFLPSSLPHVEWTLRLIAAKPGQAVTIFQATKANS
jgi:hypothetical protein